MCLFLKRLAVPLKLLERVSSSSHDCNMYPPPHMTCLKRLAVPLTLLQRRRSFAVVSKRAGSYFSRCCWLVR